MPGSLEIHLLGPFEVIAAGTPVAEAHWRRRKAKMLVKILALQPGHQIHREQLMDRLWPDLDTDAATNNLHKTIHSARRALEPELQARGESQFLTLQDQIVVLRGPLSIDAEEFERAATRALERQDAASCEAAIRLYRGDLLTEDLYEDWLTAPRHHLRNLYRNLVLFLAAVGEAAGPHRVHIERLRQLIDSDACDEEAHRALIRLLAESGNRSQALAQYRQCRDTLHRELDTEPGALTTAVYEQVLAVTPQPADPLPVAAGPPAPAVAPPARRPWLKFAALAAFAIALAGITLHIWTAREPGVPSIAILPLINESADPHLEYLCEGIPESIVNDLSQAPGLRVMAPSTVLRFKGQQPDPQAAGRQLGVGAVMTGSIRRSGSRLIIKAQLVDTRDGAQLWGGNYDRNIADAAAVQDSISREIFRKLQLRLSSGERSRLTRRHTEDPEAYQSYLKGRYQWNKRTAEGLQKGIENFRQAIERDPRYALAFAGLADCYAMLSEYRLMAPQGSFQRAEAAASRALELDDSLSEAHASLGLVRIRYEWKWEEGEKEFKRSLELNPQYPTAHQWYGTYLAARSRFPEALAQVEEAQRLDPLSPIIGTAVAYTRFFARQYDAVIQQCMQTLELEPNFVATRFYLGSAYEQKGMYAQAIGEFQKAVELSGSSTAMTAALARAYALSGDRPKAANLLKQLRDQAAQRYVSPYSLAAIYVAFGDTDRALASLEQAFAEHSGSMILLNVDPAFDPIRADARFVSILQRLRLR